MAITPINGYEIYNNYNYFTPKPVDERKAGAVENPNFFVNPPTSYTEYVPQDLFGGATAGLNNGIHTGDVVYSAASAGYAAGTQRVLGYA